MTTQTQVRSTEEALSIVDTMKLALETLEKNKQTHYYCEDTWYSCPKHEDGCANDSVGDECNCGADKANAEIDQAITAIKEALAQPEQRSVSEHLEPVDWPMEEQPDGSVIPIDPEEHPNFFTWTWDKFVSGGKWRAEYGWKKPEGFDFANLQPLYTTPPQHSAIALKPLTDAQREEIAKGWRGRNWTVGSIIDAIEAVHGIKGDA